MTARKIPAARLVATVAALAVTLGAAAAPAHAASYTPPQLSCETYDGYGVMSSRAPVMRSTTGAPQTAYWKAAIFRVSGSTVTYITDTGWRVGVVGSSDIFDTALDGSWYDLRTGAFVGDDVSFQINQSGYYAVAYYLYWAATATDGAAQASFYGAPHTDFTVGQQMGTWWCGF